MPLWPECLEYELTQPAADAVHAVAVGPDGTPGEIVRASAGGQQSFESQLAVDPEGGLTVVWHSFDGTYFCPNPHSVARVQLARGQLTVDEPEEGPPGGSTEDGQGGAAAGTAQGLPSTDAPLSAGGTLRLAGKASVRGRHAVVGATCLAPPDSTCEGTVRLVVSGGQASALQAVERQGARRRSSPALLARGGYRVAGSRRRTLALRLSPLGRRLLDERTRGLRVRVVGGRVQGRATFLATPPDRQAQLQRRQGQGR
jgi:hypothetical protein